MKVDALTLQNFRNISSLSFYPHQGANVICADNAQGKTNLLEAIWLFCGAKSFRGAKDSELLQMGEEYATLDLSFNAAGRSQTACIRYGKNEKKQAFLNEIKIKKPGDLAGEFCAVVFSPDHLWVVKHGPEKRRRLLDTALCQIYPKYQKAMEGYERILKQRTFLLKDCRKNSLLLDTLDIWDNHAAEYGSYITSMRSRYVQKLAQAAQKVYSGITKEKETLEIRYSTSFGLEGDQILDDRSELKKQISHALWNSRQEDMRLGVTTIGPHRDDLILEVDGKNAKAYASQGQQRSCVLAIKLAECELLAHAVEESPVILLDDVMSELDQGRREYLLNHIQGKQVFITCCDTSAYNGLIDGKVFFLEKGCFVHSS